MIILRNNVTDALLNGYLTVWVTQCGIWYILSIYQALFLHDTTYNTSVKTVNCWSDKMI